MWEGLVYFCNIIVNHRSFFEQHLFCSSTEKQDLIDAFEYQQVKKGDFLLESNEICDQIYFVVEGCILVNLDKGIQHTLVREIVTPGLWLTDIHGFLEKKESQLSFFTFTECSIYSLKRETFDWVKIRFPEFVEMTLNTVGKVNKALENRWFNFSHMTAEEKIQWYFEQKRFQRFDIPKKIIAQYLDLRPETFSRALKKIHP